MQKIKIKNLEIGTMLNYGSFARVYLCRHGNKEYAYKKFRRPSEIFKKGFSHKLDKLNDLDIKGAILPQKIVVEGIKPLGYLMELKDSSDKIENKQELMWVLRETKKNILEIHDKGVIHADIHSGNIITDDNQCFLVDFDNCKYKRFDPELDYMSLFAKEYVKKLGINRDLDIYLYNILAFSVIKNVDYRDVIKKIEENEKSIDFYTSKEEKDICESLLLTKKRFNNTFLTDLY